MLLFCGQVCRRMSSVAAGNQYVAGTHSVAYVTAPSEEVAKKLAQSVFIENRSSMKTLVIFNLLCIMLIFLFSEAS